MAVQCLVRRPICYKLRTLATESLRNVAIPANGPMSGQSLLEVLQGNLVPLKRLPMLIDKSRRMIVPVNLTEGLVTVSALHSFVPAIDDGGDQASLGRLLNLR